MSNTIANRPFIGENVVHGPEPFLYENELTVHERVSMSAVTSEHIQRTDFTAHQFGRLALFQTVYPRDYTKKGLSYPHEALTYALKLNRQQGEI